MSTPENNYDAANIQVLEGLEAVRKRPGMYIGSTGPRGSAPPRLRSSRQLSRTEALAGYCDEIKVTITKDGWIRVVDNGRGIPVAMHPTEGKSTLEVVMTVLHAGGNVRRRRLRGFGWLHGVGASVVNALSTHVKVQVARDGFLWHQSYTVGVPDAPVAKGEPSNLTGTTTEVLASPDIFRNG
jgi:DNA gyrase subunit B